MSAMALTCTPRFQSAPGLIRPGDAPCILQQSPIPVSIRARPDQAGRLDMISGGKLFGTFQSAPGLIRPGDPADSGRSHRVQRFNPRPA